MINIAQYPTYQVLIAVVMALVICVVVFPLWIKVLRYRNIGQQIRADGPQGHLVKQGTPTMGGVLIIIVVFAVYVAMGDFGRLSFLALAAMIGCGLLGFFDDWAKVAKERSLGLSPRAKITGQALIALLFALAAVNWGDISSRVALPLLDASVDLGVYTSVFEVGGFGIIVPWLYIGLVFLMMIATSNTVNLTDGLDGLAAGTITIVMMAYAGIAFRQDRLDIALLAAAVAGACVGFLWYNSHPADIFMGDTGSLGIGAGIAALAVITKTELLLVLIGGIYVIQGLSVILQVASFKLTGKRIFKMAPIHHHFEMLGWSETKVMVRFWVVTGILAGAGFALYFVGSVKG
ncbi:MAG: phospho-N-acetylmuramoyl-pentapeptide-transferase [Actinobacteria bacterium]|nr:phospho-N-acetylmuramoyl-pentapeptide-transferase [Actinomycetota bacterium]MCL5887297.1 phospho-N-acetylmuramoyl-pentapeptide-transferase [Actinomycetota bacterium]